MSIKKIVITNGIYQDKELRLLVSFDDCDKPVDLINLDITKVGTVCEATVEKVLNDIDACILKLSTGDKGFIENKKLKPESFTVRHSEKKLVCQEDKFWVEITQDRKSTKPYSCNFIDGNIEKKDSLDYYLSIIDGTPQIISDIPLHFHEKYQIEEYTDTTISLWELYGFTSIINRATSKVVHLKSGGNIIIEPTEALTVIDVNSSKSYGKSNPMKTNTEAIEELVHQLRLRSISGIIIIDLLKVSKSNQDALIEKLKILSKNDVSKIYIHGFSNLGLLEITRSRMFSPF
ncbi:ribonuclease, Rne/Rng family [Pseudobutyrivibrio sp. ACV-2]|uniref:ribonuclease E/G n=1 Tax=Pseudobutyrivibrio sp. ACV-2 TaxID=1520801 RepID=UPI00089CDF9F|nr:ribonuclease E/G [Pseudobutyrivibrio sp. ACV-2]SDZ81501.1 ribonuclease, Rne/Rng family [Pseudobutyrivibrio sp. ACV-2]